MYSYDYNDFRFEISNRFESLFQLNDEKILSKLLLDPLSRVALHRNSSYIKRSIRFTVHSLYLELRVEIKSTQPVVQRYECS